MCTEMCTCGRDSQGDWDSRWRVYWRMHADICTCGGSLRESLAPDGGCIGGCVLTCVLVRGALDAEEKKEADLTWKSNNPNLTGGEHTENEWRTFEDRR